MLFWTIFKVSLKSLIANKLRSVLAMLGIIIGVGAVISMLALGAGAKQQIIKQMSAMGVNLLVVRPAARGTGGVNSGTQQNLTIEDSLAILKEVHDVNSIAPVVGGTLQVKYFNKNQRVSAIGSSATYFQIRNFEIEKGRAFNDTETDRTARVAVIGPLTATNLFGTDDAIGETVKVNGINFVIIGVMKAKGDQGYFNPDDQIILPYSTAMKQVLGVDKLREIDIQAVDGSDTTTIQDAATALLRKRHKLQGTSNDDFTIRNQAEALEMRSATSDTMTILLGSIAGISLLVGGIGIMNIMLVTVTERTREIGVRKAIGAKDRDILSQFLIEAIMMSGLGGVIGVAAGVGGAELIGRFTSFATQTEIWSIVLSLSFAVFVGVFFGFYPAQRAARMNPIDALRYE